MISSDFLRDIRESGVQQIARIVVARVAGSTPREAGASMWVTQECRDGTIGGGRLEYDAIALARERLSASSERQGWRREGQSWPLGPRLGQCCGGMVDIMFELVSFTELEGFQRMLQEADIASHRVWLAYRGVRLFGQSYWDEK